MKCICISLLILLPLWAQAQMQDKIYLVNETSIENVEIVEVSKKRVKVRNQEKRVLDFKTKEVLMAFNGSGRFMVLDSRPAPDQLERFFSEEEKEAKVDVIMSASGKLIPALIEQENGSEILFHDLTSGHTGKKLFTSEIGLILYKDGNHKIFKSPTSVAASLAHAGDKLREARFADYKGLEGKSEANPFASAGSAGEAAGAQKEPGSLVASRKKTNSQASMEMDPEVYSRKALQKTADLGTYLAIISDRNNSAEEANKATELAVKLFINEDAQVEVSSSEGRNRYKIRPYLNRLKLLNYDKIEISWTDISYVSNLKKGMDGNYYGIITLQQRFKGFIDNRMVYGDLTEKNIEVMVVAYHKEKDGEQQQKWDVFLSDVGVVVTKFDQ